MNCFPAGMYCRRDFGLARARCHSFAKIRAPSDWSIVQHEYITISRPASVVSCIVRIRKHLQPIKPIIQRMFSRLEDLRHTGFRPRICDSKLRRIIKIHNNSFDRINMRLPRCERVAGQNAHRCGDVRSNTICNVEKAPHHAKVVKYFLAHRPFKTFQQRCY